MGSYKQVSKINQENHIATVCSQQKVVWVCRLATFLEPVTKDSVAYTKKDESAMQPPTLVLIL